MSKTLLILVNNLGSLVSHRLEIVLAAKKMGYKVKVAFGEKDIDTKILIEKDIDIFHVPINRGGVNPFKDLWYFLSLCVLLFRLKPDILHLVTIKPYLYGGIASRLVGVPCVVSAIAGLGSLFIQDDLFSRFIRKLLYPFYRIAFAHSNQCVIVQNNEDANLLVKWGVLKPEKVKLIKGSGVNLDKFKKFAEPDDVPIICFAARLLKEKGVNDFIEAANLLCSRGVRARYWLAGKQDLENPSGLKNEDLNEILKNDVIEFLGYQTDIVNLYAKSNIVCLPSYREGLPKSLIEAAAASRAVVTTDVPGCRDAIIPNETGLLVPTKNPKKLADALQLLIENSSKRIVMGKAGRRLAMRSFDIKIVVQDHLKIYHELLLNIR